MNEPNELNPPPEHWRVGFQEALEDGDLDKLRLALEQLHPAEIADLLEAMPGEHRLTLWQQVPLEHRGEVLSHAQDAVRAGLLEHMEAADVAAVTRELDTDDAADILQDLPEDQYEQVLRSMDEQNRMRLASVLGYPEDTAGGLMNTDVITVRGDVHLDAILRYLRWRGRLPEHTDSLMVIDRHNSYQGLLPVTALLTHAGERLVGEVLDRKAEAIPATLPAAEVAKRFEQRDLLSAPVVDEEGRLIGRITVDDVVDVIREESDHSLMSLAGLDEQDDTFAPVRVSAPRRAAWLGVNLLTAFLAAYVIGRFEATIEQIVALAILMPIVASMGGVAGSQTLTIVIRALALGQIGEDNSRLLLKRELAVGLFNGLLWAAVVGTVAAGWFHDYGLGLVIALALVTNLLAAALAGTVIPLSLKRLGIDPALAGGLFLTAVTDVIGFATFLGLATLFLL
jgi:magnesium transporter